jgi:hypothetical protein
MVGLLAPARIASFAPAVVAAEQGGCWMDGWIDWGVCVCVGGGQVPPHSFFEMKT